LPACQHTGHAEKQGRLPQRDRWRRGCALLLLLVLIQVLVLVGLIRLAWLGVRWLWRRVLRREQAATATEAG
jgi:hypothetical protein